MRDDMGKIITEPGKSHKFRKKTPKSRFFRDIENAPVREGVGKASSANCRAYSNPTSNPLRNLVEKRIGQVWKKVMAEVRDSLDMNNYEQMKMFNVFIRYDVVTEVEQIKKVGKVKVPHGLDERPIYGKIWVHPATGRLMQPIPYPPKQKEVVYPRYIAIKGKSYRVLYPKKTIEAVEEGEMDADKAVGSWFEVELQPLPGEYSGWGYKRSFQIDTHFVETDVVTGVKATGAMAVHGDYVWAKSKRQLSGREIKQLGLTDKFAGIKPQKSR